MFLKLFFRKTVSFDDLKTDDDLLLLLLDTTFDRWTFNYFENVFKTKVRFQKSAVCLGLSNYYHMKYNSYTDSKNIE